MNELQEELTAQQLQNSETEDNLRSSESNLSSVCAQLKEQIDQAEEVGFSVGSSCRAACCVTNKLEWLTVCPRLLYN